MITIAFGTDAIDKHGFITVGSVATAIAGILIEKGSRNRFQAERDGWPHVHTAVVMGKLHPLAPETLTPLSADDYGNGIVLFTELVEWGRASKLFDFVMIDRASADLTAKAGVRIKRNALIAKYERKWPSIEDDLRHSNENGLRQAAKIPNEHGYWNEPAVVHWGSERGKLLVEKELEAPKLDAMTNWALRQPS